MKIVQFSHMKGKLAAAAALIVLVLGGSAIGYMLKERAEKRLEGQKREALCRAALSAYAKDLGPGMTRMNVEDYFVAKAIPFQKGAAADLVKIGQEAGPWFCNEVDLYVAFDFEAVEPHSRAWEPTDVLKRVHIYSRAERCL